MWRSLWRSFDQLSLDEFKLLVNELQGTRFVDKLNKEHVVDILKRIVEIVTYGDQHDSSIFEYFMERNILAEFLRMLKISRNTRIEVQLLHYLSILIQNLNSEHAIYYCFSNEYINNIILHPYDFDERDLAPHYISFLRVVGGKLNKDTICLLARVQDDVVISFPLYTEALKFARHEERMIQIAVRALTLGIYNVRDDMVYSFITNPPASEYFSDLVMILREKCFNLNVLVSTPKDNYKHDMRNQLFQETEKAIDDLYYFKDIIHAGEPSLKRLMTRSLLCLLVIPVLLPSLQLNQTSGSGISAITSLYFVSRLIQIVKNKELINSVAVGLLSPYMSLRSVFSTSCPTDPASLFLEHLNEIEDHLMAMSTSEHGRSENNNIKWLPKIYYNYFLLLLSRKSCVECNTE